MSEAGSEPLIVARINGVYGVKGWVKLHSFTEPMENVLGYANWTLRRRGQWQAITIDDGRRHGKGLIAHIKGVDDRNEAELLKGSEIAIPREQLPGLAEDDYYWHQLEGLSVVNGEELLGRIDHMLETGANDVLEVDGDRRRMVPFTRDAVTQVDLGRRRIVVDWDPDF